jgi:hypothetical protein
MTATLLKGLTLVGYLKEFSVSKRILTVHELFNLHTLLANMSAQLTSQLLELPPAWLALLFQHVASGPGGLANSAALSQTCKLLHSLSEDPAVTYSNLFMAAAISSPDHSIWLWLAKRSGRISGLHLQLRATQDGVQLSGWMQPLQTLSGIPGLNLGVAWVGSIADLDHSCIALWLKQHGQLISHLTVEVDISERSLMLKDFCEAAAPCMSIDLTISHSSNEVVDLADLAPVAGSLRFLCCVPKQHGSMRGATALKSMSQLTALCLVHEDLGNEEPWDMLASLASLQMLRLQVAASGDPSPLSALTGLTYLQLESSQSEANDQPPFSFSSLQPLSTLQQLGELHLEPHTCAATSLQGLAGLSNLKVLGLDFESSGGRLSSLEGIGPGLVELSVLHSPGLVGLAGIEGCTSMEKLILYNCHGVSSLQPLWGLSSMTELRVSGCGHLANLQGLNSMSLQYLALAHCSDLDQLSGLEHFSSLKALWLEDCGVTSLQTLSQLWECLDELRVLSCKRVQEDVLELPHVQPTAAVHVSCSNVKEVVFGGGVRRACLVNESSEDSYSESSLYSDSD